ncbi:hypothetical protein BDV95DRAFT_608613 [Massariosphaeria phaeospora]|uniref:Uncharacterized protein n=1 Tax=Massariosphaeria phaeospora TaxID=100035 RepID=A0A7C8MHS5_9PLEO|nr:hypothetical protein BDV95DRAFT_608613 [Massariosphaeria phaeospora]
MAADNALPINTARLIGVMAEAMASTVAEQLVQAHNLIWTDQEQKMMTTGMGTHQEIQARLDLMLTQLWGRSLHRLGVRNALTVDIGPYINSLPFHPSLSLVPGRLIQGPDGFPVKVATEEFKTAFAEAFAAKLTRAVEAKGALVYATFMREQALHNHSHGNSSGLAGCLLRLVEDEHEISMRGGVKPLMTFEINCQDCAQKHMVRVLE